jgi:hypothetical protein
MKIAVRLALLAAAIAAGVWLWTVFFPSPEKIIRARLAQLAGDASFNSGEGTLVVLNKTEKLAGLFSTNVEVNLDVPGRFQHSFASRGEIALAAAAARSEVSGLKVEFLDANVVVGADKLSATADLTVKAQAAGDKDFIVQEMKFTFQKIGGDWLITRVETVRTLS